MAETLNEAAGSRADPGSDDRNRGHHTRSGVDLVSFEKSARPDTPTELVLLDIADWQFEWQFNYRPVDKIVVQPGDQVRLECSWDRGLRDPDLEPAYVLWADGTDDEMCFATIMAR